MEARQSRSLPFTSAKIERIEGDRRSIGSPLHRGKLPLVRKRSAKISLALKLVSRENERRLLPGRVRFWHFAGYARRERILRHPWRIWSSWNERETAGSATDPDRRVRERKRWSIRKRREEEGEEGREEKGSTRRRRRKGSLFRRFNRFRSERLFFWARSGTNNGPDGNHGRALRASRVYLSTRAVYLCICARASGSAKNLRGSGSLTSSSVGENQRQLLVRVGSASFPRRAKEISAAQAIVLGFRRYLCVPNWFAISPDLLMAGS